MKRTITASIDEHNRAIEHEKQLADSKDDNIPDHFTLKKLSPKTYGIFGDGELIAVTSFSDIAPTPILIAAILEDIGDTLDIHE